MDKVRFVIKVNDLYRIYQGFNQDILKKISLGEHYHLFNRLIDTHLVKRDNPDEDFWKKSSEDNFAKLIEFLGCYNTQLESLFLLIHSAYVYSLIRTAFEQSGYKGRNLLNYFLVEIDRDRADEFEKYLRFDTLIEAFYRRGELRSGWNLNFPEVFPRSYPPLRSRPNINADIDSMIKRSYIPTVGPGRRQVKVVDFEQGWNLTYEGIMEFGQRRIKGGGHNYNGAAEHGAKTLQVLAGKPKNRLHFTGLCPFAQIELGSTRFSSGKERREAALVAVLGNNRDLKNIMKRNDIDFRSFDLSRSADLRAGDIVLLEIQIIHPFYIKKDVSYYRDERYLPVEIEKAMFDIIKYATQSRIIIIEAAGNGNTNLDDIDIDEMNRILTSSTYSHFSEDSGAIIVSTKKDTDLGNWGQKVNTYMISNFINTASNDYRGSSSASALVTGMAAILQQTAFNNHREIPNIKTLLKNGHDASMNFEAKISSATTPSRT